MNTNENVKLFYPLPLAKVYEAARLESDPRLRARKLIGFYEEILRFLGLAGLGSYDYYNLTNDKVEAVREELGKPTLGTWLKLVATMTKALKPKDKGFLTPPLSIKYLEEEAIHQSTQAIRVFLGRKPLKHVMLNDFLNALVNFRNRKIGHGTLSEAEARHILPYLESGLNQWLDSLSTLKERHLVYVDKVEFKGPHYLYSGVNLNSGTSLDPFHVEAADKIDPKQVYWHLAEKDRFVPLQSYFSYHHDTKLVYIYRHLSDEGQPELVCPYEQPGPYQQIDLSTKAGDNIAKPRKKKPEPRQETKPVTPKKKRTSAMHNWFDIITPHKDIRKGHFDEAVFAADLGDVYAGTAANDYNDPFLFFKKTYLTTGLEGLLRRVDAKLAKGQGASVIQIQTPFGGGKTHALVAIFHYLKNGKRVKSLLPTGVDIQLPKLSVISGDHWNPLEGQSSNGVTRRTFWGEMAYQVGGQEGYEAFRANDEAMISPGKDDLREFLEQHQPFVLLFDEILEYINRAHDVRAAGQIDVSLGTQTFSFFQELSETVASLARGMLVVTLPSSQLEDFGEREEESLARLGKIFGRVETIETPVQGEEVYAVIRRRLFEIDTLKGQPMREIVHKYFQVYQQNRGDLPPKARDVSYRDKMELAYPFHPDVIDILYEKWSTFSSFQRTRGVLRLLANVVEDLYQREVNLDLIMPGDINLDRPAVRQEFLKHIGAEYEGVVGSDIAGHEAKSLALDKVNKQWKHLSQRISTAIFFHSFTAAESEKGVSLPYIKLSVLRSDTIPALVTDVLQKLGSALWYLNSRGETYYFSRIPNLNRMILDKKELFNESYEEALEELIKKELGHKFRTYLWPSKSDDIRDNRELKLVILHPQDSGAEIPDWIERRGDSFREFKGTLYFALSEAAAFAQLREDVKTHLALQEIEAEVKKEPSSPLATKRQEIGERMHKLERDFSWKVRRMYHILQIGDRRVDLGQPVAGKESLDSWFWRELTSSDVGAIVKQLHYRVIVNRLMAGNEKLATSVILDQFYKDTTLPAPASPEVVARAIQMGVEEGAIGLTVTEDGEIKPEMVRFKEVVALNAVAFESGIYVLSRETSEALLVEIETPDVSDESVPGDDESEAGIPPIKPVEPVKPPTPGEVMFNHVRLVIEGIPASKIADVNRGIFMPLSQSVDNLEFRLEIDVKSDDGISQSTLDNKIKETIRQIGATLIDEEQE